MTKENTLFAIIGVLLGFIVGFMFANSVNQREAHAHPPQTTTATAEAPLTQSSTLEGDHPAAVSDEAGGMMPDVQAKIQRAKDEPDNFQAQLEAAELYYRIGRFDRAIELLLRANQLRPENYEVVLNIGNANLEAKRYAEAERWYTTATIKKPEDVAARTGLGSTFLFREPPDVNRAIAEFKRSLDINPSHEGTLGRLVDAFVRKGDGNAARETLARLEQINPTNEELGALRSRVEELQSSARS